MVTGKVAPTLAQYPADIVFLDPPYEQEREYAACLEVLGGMTPGLVVVQHATRFELADSWGTLKRVRLLKQGDNSLSFFEPCSEPEHGLD